MRDFLRRVRGGEVAALGEAEVESQLLALVKGDRAKLAGVFLVDVLVYEERKAAAVCR